MKQLRKRSVIIISDEKSEIQPNMLTNFGLTKSIREYAGTLNGNLWDGIWKNGFEGAISEFKLVPEHIYILSDDEIKKGDWFIRWDLKNGFVLDKKYNGMYLYHDMYKVIASTNSDLHKDGIPSIQISDIERYINRYNAGNSIMPITVEYEKCQTYIDDACDVRFPCCNNPIKLKLTKDGSIIINLMKDNFTREEVINILRNVPVGCITGDEVEDWFNQQEF